MNKSKPKQIVLRCSESEYQRIKSLVKKSGMNQQEYLLNCALGADIVNTSGLKELIPQVSKVGNNLNQIARKLNSQGYVDYDGELADALKGCDEVWQLLRSSVQKRV